MLRRKKVWMTILVSYLFILLLPVTIGGFMYQRVEQILVEQANRANLGLLEQARQNVDSRMTEMNRIILQLSLDPNLRWLMDNAGDNHALDQQHYVPLMKELSRIINVSDFISSLHFHFPKPGTVLTDRLKTDQRLYYERIQRFDQIIVGMPQLLSQFHFRTMYPATAVTEGDVSKRMIPYVQTYPLDETDLPLAALVILINEQKMIGMLEQIDWAGEGTVYVMNEKHQTITKTPGSLPIPDSVLDRLSIKAGSFTYKHDGITVMISSVKGENGWRYVSVVPESIVMKKVDQVKFWSLILFLLYLIIGTALSILLTYRNYKPVREVVRWILNKKQDYGTGASNEYDLIKNAVVRSMNEEQSLREALLKQMPAAKANLLTRLLKGHTRLWELDTHTLHMVGGPLESRFFRVVLLDIENCQPFAKDDSVREWALVRFVLSNLLDDVVGPDGFVVELERNRLAVLLSVRGDFDETVKESWLENLKPLVEQRFRIQFTAAVSSFHEGAEGIGVCYTEALTALEYRVTQGSNSTIYYNDHKSLKRFSYYYPMETEVQIINFIKTGDYHSAEQALTHIYDINFRQNRITPDLSRFLFQEIVGTFLKAVDIHDGGESAQEHGCSALAPSIAKCNTAEEMLEAIKSGLRLICDSMREDRTGHGQALYAQIIEFIERHYEDSNLSLTLLAGHFGITPQYLSTFFKKQSGVNLSDYITGYRIEVAKALLEQSDMTIGDISRKVGYANHIGFGRVFKKSQGITPGQYRETRGM